MPADWRYRPRWQRREEERQKLAQTAGRIQTLYDQEDPLADYKAEQVISQERGAPATFDALQQMRLDAARRANVSSTPEATTPTTEKKKKKGFLSKVVGAAKEVADIPLIPAKSVLDQPKAVYGAGRSLARGDVTGAGKSLLEGALAMPKRAISEYGDLAKGAYEPASKALDVGYTGVGAPLAGILTGSLAYEREPVYNEQGLIVGYKRTPPRGTKVGPFDIPTAKQISTIGSGLLEGIQHPAAAGRAFNEAMVTAPPAAQVGTRILLDPTTYIAPGAVSGIVNKASKGKWAWTAAETPEGIRQAALKAGLGIDQADELAKLGKPLAPGAVRFATGVAEGLPSKRGALGAAAGAAGAAQLSHEADTNPYVSAAATFGGAIAGATIAGNPKIAIQGLRAAGTRAIAKEAPMPAMVFGKGVPEGETRPVRPIRPQSVHQKISKPVPAANDRLFFHSTNNFEYEVPDPERGLGTSVGVSQLPGVYSAADPAKSASRYGDRTLAFEFDGTSLNYHDEIPTKPLQIQSQVGPSGKHALASVDNSHVRLAQTPSGKWRRKDSVYTDGVGPSFSTVEEAGRYWLGDETTTVDLDAPITEGTDVSWDQVKNTLADRIKAAGGDPSPFNSFELDVKKSYRLNVDAAAPYTNGAAVWSLINEAERAYDTIPLVKVSPFSGSWDQWGLENVQDPSNAWFDFFDDKRTIGELIGHMDWNSGVGDSVASGKPVIPESVYASTVKSDALIFKALDEETAEDLGWWYSSPDYETNGPYRSKEEALQGLVEDSKDPESTPTIAGRFSDLVQRDTGSGPMSMYAGKALVADVLSDLGIDSIFYRSTADGEVLVVLNGEKARVIGDIRNLPKKVSEARTWEELKTADQQDPVELQRKVDESTRGLNRQIWDLENGAERYRSVMVPRVDPDALPESRYYVGEGGYDFPVPDRVYGATAEEAFDKWRLAKIDVLKNARQAIIDDIVSGPNAALKAEEKLLERLQTEKPRLVLDEPQYVYKVMGSNPDGTVRIGFTDKTGYVLDHGGILARPYLRSYTVDLTSHHMGYQNFKSVDDIISFLNSPRKGAVLLAGTSARVWKITDPDTGEFIWKASGVAGDYSSSEDLIEPARVQAVIRQKAVIEDLKESMPSIRAYALTGVPLGTSEILRNAYGGTPARMAMQAVGGAIYGATEDRENRVRGALTGFLTGIAQGAAFNPGAIRAARAGVERILDKEDVLSAVHDPQNLTTPVDRAGWRPLHYENRVIGYATDSSDYVVTAYSDGTFGVTHSSAAQTAEDNLSELEFKTPEEAMAWVELKTTSIPDTEIKPVDTKAVEDKNRDFKAAIGLSPDYFRSEVRNRYPNPVNFIAEKEMIQNSVDASRSIPGAQTTVVIDNDSMRIRVDDEGTGMLPELLANEFTKLGGSSKATGSAGGFGTAKTAFLGNARRVDIVTVAKDTDGTYQVSMLWGSSDDYLDPSKGFTVRTRKWGDLTNEEAQVVDHELWASPTMRKVSPAAGPRFMLVPEWERDGSSLVLFSDSGEYQWRLWEEEDNGVWGVAEYRLEDDGDPNILGPFSTKDKAQEFVEKRQHKLDWEWSTVVDASVAGPDLWPVDAQGNPKTGTRIKIQFLPDVSYSEEAAKKWRESFMANHGLTDQRVRFIMDGSEVEPDPTIAAATYVGEREVVLSSGKKIATLKFYSSSDVQERGYIPTVIRNAGLPQITENIWFDGNTPVPSRVVVDVIPHVGAKDGGYPWSPDRSGLTWDTHTALKDFVQNDIVGVMKKAEVFMVESAMENGPTIVGQLRFVDASGSLSPEEAARISQEKYLYELVTGFKIAHDRLLARFKGRVYGLGIIGDSDFYGVSMSKPGTGTGFLGINVSTDKRTSQIMIDPWIYSNEFTEDADVLTGQVMATLIHEIAHNTTSRGHDESFAGVITRMMGDLPPELYMEVRAEIRQSWMNVLSDQFMREAYRADIDIQRQLRNNQNIFKKFGATDEPPSSAGAADITPSARAGAGGPDESGAVRQGGEETEPAGSGNVRGGQGETEARASDTELGGDAEPPKVAAASGVTWVTMRPSEIARILGTDDKRLLKRLDDLDAKYEQGLLTKAEAAERKSYFRQLDQAYRDINDGLAPRWRLRTGARDERYASTDARVQEQLDKIATLLEKGYTPEQLAAAGYSTNPDLLKKGARQYVSPSEYQSMLQLERVASDLSADPKIRARARQRLMSMQGFGEEPSATDSHQSLKDKFANAIAKLLPTEDKLMGATFRKMEEADAPKPPVPETPTTSAVGDKNKVFFGSPSRPGRETRAYQPEIGVPPTEPPSKAPPVAEMPEPPMGPSVHASEDALTQVKNAKTEEPTFADLGADKMFKEKHERASLYEAVMDVINLPRSVVARFDLSFLIRQGGMLGARYPKKWADAASVMVQAFKSEDTAKAINAAMMNEPRAAKFSELGLYEGAALPWEHSVGPHKGIPRNHKDEAYMSKIADRLLGGVPTERANMLFLKKLRNDVANELADAIDARALSEGRMSTEQEYRQIVDFVLNATGRGSIKGLTDNSQLFTSTFFSLRWLASRASMPKFLFSSNPEVRKAAWTSFGAFVGTGMTVLGLLELSGLAEVEADPRSSDFGKIRIGDQRYEFWAGYQPLARLAAQLVTGERKSISTGNITHIDRFWGTTESPGALASFVTGKFSPTARLLYNAATGQQGYGDELKAGPHNIGGIAYTNLVPLVIQDMIDGYRAAGPAGVAASTPSFIGVGAARHQPLTHELDSFAKALAKDSKDYPSGVTGYHDLLPKDRMKVREEHPTAWANYLKDAGSKLQRSEEVALQIKEKQDALDQALLSGELPREKWIAANSDLRLELSARRKEIYGDKPMTQKDIKSPIDAYYYQIQQAQDETGQLDFSKVDAWLNAQDAQTRRTIQENTGLSGTPLARAFSEARREYYDLPKYRGYTADEGYAIDELYTYTRQIARSADKSDMLIALTKSSKGYPPKVVQGARRRLLGLLDEDPARKKWKTKNKAMATLFERGRLAPKEVQLLERELAETA